MSPTITAWYYPREHNTLDRVRHIPTQQPATVEYQKYIKGSWVSVDFSQIPVTPVCLSRMIL